MSDTSKLAVNVKLNTESIDETIIKAEKLIALLIEAKQLAKDIFAEFD